MEYYVYITNDCNLNCAYCSVLFECQKSGIPFVPAYRDDELARFIDRTQRQYHDRDVRIFLFGGEPTLEYGRIEHMLDVCCKELSDYNLKLTLHTNGLLLDQIPDSVLSRLSLIILSINYEEIPKHHMGDGYFRKIMDNLAGIRSRSKVQVMARFTATEQTGVYSGVMMAHGFFDLVFWQLENTPAFTDYPSFYRTYTFEVELLFTYWLSALRDGRLLKWIPFMSALRSLVGENCDDGCFCCGYGSRQIYVQTDGTCYSCCDRVADGTHYIGSIKDGFAFSHGDPSEYHCKDCEYRTMCMGRCGRMHRDFAQEHVKEYCELNKFMFDLFLRHRSELEGLLQKHDGLREQLSGWLIDITELTP